MVTNNPYHDLGVEPTATPEVIRRAYKRRARETHPDKGGDTAQFQRVNAAYQLLSDETRRRRFDETGEDARQEDQGARVLGIIGQLVLQVIDDPNFDVNTKDVLREVRRRIERDIETVRLSQKELRKHINRRERALKRITKRSGENIVAHMIGTEIGKMKAQVEQMNQNVELGRAALKGLEDYQYRVDDAPPPAAPGSIFTILTA